jgi:hypothetical protein
MAVRTAEDLEDSIEESLSWRRIELSALKSAIQNAGSGGSNSPLCRALCRSGVAMLYAHWEGFFKDACQWYLEYVIKSKPVLADLSDGLLLTAMKSLYQKSQSGDPVADNSLVNLVRQSGRVRARIPRDVVRTRSNLRHQVVVEILGALGLATSLFETKSMLIDHSLCDARNAIAHGRDSLTTPEEFQDLFDAVLEMMGQLRTEISNAVRI